MKWHKNICQVYEVILRSTGARPREDTITPFLCVIGFIIEENSVQLVFSVQLIGTIAIMGTYKELCVDVEQKKMLCSEIHTERSDENIQAHDSASRPLNRKNHFITPHAVRNQEQIDDELNINKPISPCSSASSLSCFSCDDTAITGGIGKSYPRSMFGDFWQKHEPERFDEFESNPFPLRSSLLKDDNTTTENTPSPSSTNAPNRLEQDTQRRRAIFGDIMYEPRQMSCISSDSTLIGLNEKRKNIRKTVSTSALLSSRRGNRKKVGLSVRFDPRISVFEFQSLHEHYAKDGWWKFFF